MNMLMTRFYNCLFAVFCFIELGQGQDFIFICSCMFWTRATAVAVGSGDTYFKNSKRDRFDRADKPLRSSRATVDEQKILALLGRQFHERTENRWKQWHRSLTVDKCNVGPRRNRTCKPHGKGTCTVGSQQRWRNPTYHIRPQDFGFDSLAFDLGFCS